MKLPRLPDRGELAALFNALPEREALLAELIYRSGLRASEALSLTADDFSGDLASVRVTGKGKKDRIVVIVSGPEFQAKLRAWLRHHRKNIFITRRGTSVADSHFRRVLARAGKRIGLKFRLHPHTLRHAHATALLEQEHPVSLEIIRDQLGHVSIATTQIYTHLSLKTRKSVLSRAKL